MDLINNTEITQKYHEQVKDIFKNLVSCQVYEKWADTFELDGIDQKKVLIVYHGMQSIKKFKKECKEGLLLSVRSVFGSKKRIKITKKRKLAVNVSPKVKKNIKAAKFFVLGMVFVCVATFVIVVMCNYIGNRNFRETFYGAASIKTDSEIRVIQLSDLHSTSYGKNNEKLIDRIKALEPDIIICTGDMVNSVKEDEGFAVSLCTELAKIAPSYYIYGNNEIDDLYDFNFNLEELDGKFGFDDTSRDETMLLSLDDSFEKKLESVGIKVLKNEKDTIKINTTVVDIYGVLTSNPSSFWQYSKNSFSDYIYENTDNLKITAVHEPFIFEELQTDSWGDLIVCGHTHGGLVRIPVLGPLYTKEGGLFPERNGNLVYGRYNIADNIIIVSPGLENKNLLRINNQPELVVIDINKF